MSTPADHIQLIWDRAGTGTAQAESGCSIPVGPTGDWTPERLLTAAVESSVMTNFLRLAEVAGLEVLGYVSAGESRYETGTCEAIKIIVRPCVAVGGEEHRDLVHRLLTAAVAASPIVRALGDATTLAAEVIVLGASDGG